MRSSTAPFILFFPLLMLVLVAAHGQQLHFDRPHLLLPDAITDKAVDITNFKGGYFLTWKEPGKSGKVRLSYLGRKYDTSGVHATEEALDNEKTPFAPVFRVWKDRLYLFWILPDGTIKYIINRTDTDFVKEDIHVLALKQATPANLGITATSLGERLVIATHAKDHGHMLYALLKPNAEGMFPVAEMKQLPGKMSTDYPFVVSLRDSVVQFTWKGEGSQPITRANFNVVTGSWITSSPIARTSSPSPPAVYHLWNTADLFYIWRGEGKDTKTHYSVHTIGDSSSGNTALPEYFNTFCPVSICTMDGNNFLVAFVRENGRIYQSRFANYNPASWMGDILMPEKGSYTLQDIVIPGSHDAGMSVLTAAGGIQSGTINECNTLTQAMNVSRQLNAGLRMFDLRVGTFNNQLYIKHCAADCMSDAIGGGYGEKLDAVLDAIRKFLDVNKKEVILLTFSHFCRRETPVDELATHILDRLGKLHVFQSTTGNVHAARLAELAGKVIVTFEGYARSDRSIDSCTIAGNSNAYVNFRREYAATNDLQKLLARQESFFYSLKGTLADNDLIRLDWQLTEGSDEAAMICNALQSNKANPMLDAAMLLTHVVRHHKSILDLSLVGNSYLPIKCNEWMDKGILTVENKPNILYVDAAGDWITDYCVFLNQTRLYRKR